MTTPRLTISLRETSRRAFTLIELAVVIFIMSILTAIAAPAFYDSLLFYRVESAARRVKADLELVRQTAKLTSATQSATFGGAAYTTSAGVAAFDRPAESYAVNLAAAPYHLTNVAADFEGDDTIAFDGYGTPSASGTVVLTAPNHQCTVTLDADTGEITISRNHAAGEFTE
jgi:prepilin-type N-terminal cleavage/methylation domain-containing protein